MRRVAVVRKIGRKGMAGMSNIILAFGLIVLCTISLVFITTSLSKTPKNDIVEIAINNNVYPMRDTLEHAKQQYIDNSAEFSLFSGAYENGLKGGFKDIEPDGFYEHGGMKYALWYDNKDTAPTEKDITDDLTVTTKGNLFEYTNNKKVKSYFIANTPIYSKLTITNINNFSIRMNTSGTADLSLTKTSENGDTVTVKEPSLINLTFSLPYYRLFVAAREYHQMLHEPFEDRLMECDKGEIESTQDKPGFTFVSELIETDDGSCLVRVEAATKKTYKVWDGNKLVLDNIRLVFMERRGPEQSRLCISSGSLSDDDEYPSRTVFRNIDECIIALGEKATEFADDEHFSASTPTIDTLTIDLKSGASLIHVFQQFSEVVSNVENSPPMSRLMTTPSSEGEYRIACMPDGGCTKMFCELNGLYHECFGLDSQRSSELSVQDKMRLILEAQTAARALERCEKEVISSGPWSIYLALINIGMNADTCVIIDMRKSELLSLRRILSAFGEENVPVTWPAQLASVLESQGAAVQRMAGDEDLLRRTAVEEAEKPDRAVIIRVSLDERNSLLSQYYMLARKDPDGMYYYLESHKKPIHEIYIISDPAA
jgi:hypothetical protein